MQVIVFTGPTLSADEVAQIIEAECQPPVAQGDVYRAALRGPQAIGIIDGYFERVPSVWHKEILWAMSQGIHVFGAASMGALRAAELASMGMVGVGAIFKAYHDGELEDDDEVAVLHGPSGETYRFSSEAMVNIRATLSRAREEEIVPPNVCDTLLGIAKALYYPDRSWSHLLAAGAAEGVPGIDALREWLPHGRVNQKREDAVAMLQSLRDFLAGDPGPKRVSYAFQETLHWEDFVRAAAQPYCEGQAESDRAVLEALERDPEARVRAESAALGWWLALERVRHQESPLVAATFLSSSGEFCARHDISDSDSLSEWLKKNQCDIRYLDRIFETRARALEAWHSAPAEATTILLDYLRWTGDYGTLLNGALTVKKPRPRRRPRGSGRPRGR